MIDYEILQDIITDHELCKVQENELAKVVELLKVDRLIELPCKMGDTVYWVCEKIPFKRDFTYEIVPRMFTIFLFDRIGEDIFLTEEDAERKLAELKGE